MVGEKNIILILIAIAGAALLMYLTMIKPYEDMKKAWPPCSHYINLNSIYTPARCWGEIK